MALKSNIALSYIAMLTVVGFFLWVIRNFIRGLKQNIEPTPVLPSPLPMAGDDKKKVDWPVHIYLSKTDDIPIPGKIISVSLADAFMESSACLHTGQKISLYVDVARQEQLRLEAKVLWARQSRDGRNAAQLSFPGLSLEKKNELIRLAGKEK